MAAIAITDMRNRQPTKFYGPNIAKNGDFSNGSTDWSLNPNIEVNSGDLRTITPFTSTGGAFQAVGRPGKYMVSFDILQREGASSVQLQPCDDFGGSNGGALTAEVIELGRHWFEIDTTGLLGFRIRIQGGTGIVRIDNVEYREVTEHFNLGPNLLVKGGWALSGSWTEDNFGDLHHAPGSTANAVQSGLVDGGKIYNLKYEIAGSDEGGFVAFRLGDLATNAPEVTPNENGEYEFQLVAASVDDTFAMRAGSSLDAQFKNIELRRVLSETIEETTLGASDTLAYVADANMVLVLRNASGGALTPNLNGDDDTPIFVLGLGDFHTSNGLTLPSVADGDVVAVHLDSISEYLKGNLTITGADGMVATCVRY